MTYKCWILSIERINSIIADRMLTLSILTLESFEQYDIVSYKEDALLSALCRIFYCLLS